MFSAHRQQREGVISRSEQQDLALIGSQYIMRVCKVKTSGQKHPGSEHKIFRKYVGQSCYLLDGYRFEFLIRLCAI